MTSKEIMQLAIDSYGRVNQVIKTVEELSELSQALCKFLHLNSLTITRKFLKTFMKKWLMLKLYLNSAR